jgi:arsenate reductase
MKIYHNPRCRKSREGLEILRNSGCEFEIIEYLKSVPMASDLAEIIEMLGIKPSELVRTSESIYKEKYKGRSMTDDQWIEAMIEYPKLIQRPILVSGKKAILGRPPEQFNTLL